MILVKIRTYVRILSHGRLRAILTRLFSLPSQGYSLKINSAPRPLQRAACPVRAAQTEHRTTRSNRQPRQGRQNGHLGHKRQTRQWAQFTTNALYHQKEGKTDKAHIWPKTETTDKYLHTLSNLQRRYRLYHSGRSHRKATFTIWSSNFYQISRIQLFMGRSWQNS